MTTTDFYTAMAALATKLAAFRPALDTRDLNPPGVLILPPAASFRFGDGSYTATWTVIPVVPNAGTEQAIKSLSSLVAGIRAALDGAPVQAEPYTLALDGQSDPLPAYQLTWSDVIR